MSESQDMKMASERYGARVIVVGAVAIMNFVLLIAYEQHLFTGPPCHAQGVRHMRLGVADRVFVQRRLYQGVQPSPKPCPQGMYRPTGSGTTVGECEFCPRGFYGDSPGLVSSDCTAKCPKGTYNDKLGAKSVLECKPCPRGVFGASTGLTTSECTGPCPDGKYSMTEGLQSASECLDCAANYRGPQGFRGNNVFDVHGGGYPCDRYLVGASTIVNGRSQAAIDAINSYLSVERTSNKNIIDNVTP